MQFFNFGNDESFHFFKWVCESGLVDVQRLIDEAFQNAEHDKWLEIGTCVSWVVRDKLADLLQDVLD